MAMVLPVEDDMPEEGGALSGRPKMQFASPQEAKAALVAARRALAAGRITPEQFEDIRTVAEPIADPLEAAVRKAEADIAERQRVQRRVQEDAGKAATAPKQFHHMKGRPLG